MLCIGLVAAELRLIGGSVLSFTPSLAHLETFRTESVALPTRGSSSLSGPHAAHLRPAGECPGRSPSLFLHVQMSTSVARRTGAAARSAKTSQEASNVPAIAASRLPRMAGTAKVSPRLSNCAPPTSLSREGSEHPLEMVQPSIVDASPQLGEQRQGLPVHTGVFLGNFSPQSLQDRLCGHKA